MPITSDSRIIDVNKIGRKRGIKAPCQEQTLEHFHNISDPIHYTSKQTIKHQASKSTKWQQPQ